MDESKGGTPRVGLMTTTPNASVAWAFTPWHVENYVRVGRVSLYSLKSYENMGSYLVRGWRAHRHRGTHLTLLRAASSAGRACTLCLRGVGDSHSEEGYSMVRGAPINLQRSCHNGSARLFANTNPLGVTFWGRRTRGTAAALIGFVVAAAAEDARSCRRR